MYIYGIGSRVVIFRHPVIEKEIIKPIFRSELYRSMSFRPKFRNKRRNSEQRQKDIRGMKIVDPILLWTFTVSPRAILRLSSNSEFRSFYRRRQVFAVGSYRSDPGQAFTCQQACVIDDLPVDG